MESEPLDAMMDQRSSLSTKKGKDVLMSPIVHLALEAITARANLDTGLTHSNDKNAAKEMFVRLREAGEMLTYVEIEAWAQANGWQLGDARRLARMGEEIGMGVIPRIAEGSWWRDDIIAQFQALVGNSA